MDVFTAQGDLLGRGAYSPYSQIVVRMWSFDPEAPISSDFFRERLQRAIKAGDDVRAKAQEVAKTEAEALLNRARQEIQQERDEAINVVRREFADLTVLAAGKVIEQSLDKDKHKELIEKVLEESSVNSQE